VEFFYLLVRLHLLLSPRMKSGTITTEQYLRQQTSLWILKKGVNWLLLTPPTVSRYRNPINFQTFSCAQWILTWCFTSFLHSVSPSLASITNWTWSLFTRWRLWICPKYASWCRSSDPQNTNTNVFFLFRCCVVTSQRRICLSQEATRYDFNFSSCPKKETCS
jgi:hypothetical protein